MSTTPSRKKRVELPLRKKLVFSALATLLFFVLLEGVLAVIGVEPETESSDRFVGFSNLLPLMEQTTNEQGEPILQTAENKLHWFNFQSFPKTKAAGTKRIFCMGGSTTYGHPYWDLTSFSGWMRQHLPIIDPSHQWEVINAGGISYASYRVAALMEELAAYEPDLFVVYSVHNEFLERRTYANLFERSSWSLAASAWLAKTRVWSVTDRIVKRVRYGAKSGSSEELELLPGEVNEILNHTIGPVDYHRDDAWRAKVIAHYEANLRHMVQIARRAGAKIVFVSPASNEKDCSPFKSEHPENIRESDRELFAQLLDQARQALQQPDLTSADASLRAAQTIDDRYAELHYRWGELYLAKLQEREAQASFARAIDEDICPLRATTEIRSAVHKVAEDLQVPLVDFEQHLRSWAREQSGSSILGDEFFLDHVHPTIEVNRRWSFWIINKLQQHNIIEGTSVTDPALEEKFQVVREDVLAQLDLKAEAFGVRNLAKVFHWAGKYEEAMPLAQDALELVPEDPESLYIVASCLANTGRVQESLDEYAHLFANGEGFHRAYQPYGELLAAEGQLEQAKAYLLLAVLRSPNNASAYTSLGMVHLRLGEKDFAREAFEESLRIAPDDVPTMKALEQCKP